MIPVTHAGCCSASSPPARHPPTTISEPCLSVLAPRAPAARPPPPHHHHTTTPHTHTCIHHLRLQDGVAPHDAPPQLALLRDARDLGGAVAVRRCRGERGEGSWVAGHVRGRWVGGGTEGGRVTFLPGKPPQPPGAGRSLEQASTPAATRPRGTWRRACRWRPGGAAPRNSAPPR
jgi:hypothetical protein